MSSHGIFRPIRATRGSHLPTISRKATLSRREFEAARRSAGSTSSLPADRRRGYRRRDR
jgi:hypothetical protein